MGLQLVEGYTRGVIPFASVRTLHLGIIGISAKERTPAKGLGTGRHSSEGCKKEKYRKTCSAHRVVDISRIIGNFTPESMNLQLPGKHIA